MTSYHGLDGLNDNHVSLMVLETGKFKIKAPAVGVSGENPLAGVQLAIFSLLPHTVESGELSGDSFIRALVPFTRSPLT